MKIITQFFTAVVLFSLVGCASSKGDIWVVTDARGNQFQNQHSKRWYKLDKGTEARVGDSLMVVYDNKTRFSKITTQSEQTAMNKAKGVGN